ncbi:MAG: hydroxyacylglutathione hydrolase [Gammaproteobacteria bacterium]|nr:MAG: hydroxyacylglutathione hydrolase [Gammaproteobacteria bacterium]
MLNIYPIKAFSDNYIWIIQDTAGHAVVVDPGDEEPVIDYIEQNGLQLKAILITHKHGDHVGGIADLKQHYPEAVVYGPAREAIRGIDKTLVEGDTVSFVEPECRFEVMDVPGHTEGHIAYYGHGVLFCGDTLFACGCGRVFSGTFEQLHDSLKKISNLPPETLVYCAHEYTQDNIGFAKWVEPENSALLARERDASSIRQQGLPTVPSSLQLELETNPFLRDQEPKVRQAAERYIGKSLDSGTEIFTAIRRWKDSEYD